MRSAEEILENVLWLIDALDEDMLEEVQDLPFLEMAKVISITPVSSRVCALLGDPGAERSSISMKEGAVRTNDPHQQS